MKLTVKELNEKLQLVSQISLDSNDKLTYAIRKLHISSNKAISVVRTYIQDKVTDLHLEYASTDDKGILIEKDNQYQYTKENKIKLVQGVRDLNKEFDSTEVEIQPFLISSENAPRILELDQFLVDEIGDILFKVDKTISYSDLLTDSFKKFPESDGPPGQTYPPPPLTTP